jgi:hypothetical protein
MSTTLPHHHELVLLRCYRSVFRGRNLYGTALRNVGGGIIEDVGGGPGDRWKGLRKRSLSLEWWFRVRICRRRRFNFKISLGRVLPNFEPAVATGGFFKPFNPFFPSTLLECIFFVRFDDLL